jgi:hypothetical protein
LIRKKLVRLAGRAAKRLMRRAPHTSLIRRKLVKPAAKVARQLMTRVPPTSLIRRKLAKLAEKAENRVGKVVPTIVKKVARTARVPLIQLGVEHQSNMPKPVAKAIKINSGPE